MNAERLLALHERIADAPDAVARLRRFVLDLAVRGKLVLQDVEDEPASELLKRIAREKARLEEAGGTRRPKAASPLADLPFAIPSNWRWSQLAEIGLLSPRNDALNTCETSFVSMPLIFAEYGVTNQHEVRTWGTIKKGYTHFAEGDVGLAKITPCFENGKSTVFRKLTGGIGAGTTELHIVRPLFVDQKYILIFLKSPHFIETGIPRMIGTAGQKRVPTEYFAYSPFPLPPLAEQHRIVAKVDELMGLCDRLEAARAGREAVRDRLAMASLARLAAPDPETFQADARFILDTLPALTERPNQIKFLRDTILNLAVRGRLVVSTEAKAASVGDYRVLQNGYAFKSDWFSKSGVRLLRNANIGHDQVHWHDVVHLPESRFSEFERFQLREGDIVLTLDRPFIITGTKAARISANDLPSLLLQRVGRFVTISPGLDNRYLFLWINSPQFNDQIDPGRSNGVPHISSKQVEAAKILVPPLAEQHRIVAKVDALMSLCDRLEAALTASDSARARLLNAVLAEALAPADDSSGATVEPTAGAATPGAAVTTERSAFVLLLAYERHRSARRDRTFGHVKAEKILHLVEAEAGLDLGRAPVRIAAGPADFPRLLAVDRWAKQHRRFAFDKRGKGYTFERLTDFQTSLDVASTIDAPTRARVEAIIDLFVPMDTEAAELFATIYAAWNNLLIEGKSPDDADILQAAREDWHPDKLKIPRDRFAAALRHLRASEFVPSGRGKFVPPAPQRDLFSRQ